MKIREWSKKIARYLLEKAMKQGTFKKSHIINYGELAKDIGIGLESCRLCCEYLESIGCIEINNNPDGNSTDFLFRALPAVVDFLECYITV